MIENDSSAFTEPFLPLHNGDESQRDFVEERNVPQEQNDDIDLPSSTSSYEQFPYPPELTKIATINVRRSLGIVFVDLATKSLWNQNILSIFVSFAWNNQHVGILQATIGMSQTASSAIAKWWTMRSPKSQLHCLVHAAFLCGIAAITLSIWSITNVQSHSFTFHQAFTRFADVNALWALMGGLLEMALPMLFLESMSILPAAKQQQIEGMQEKLALGSSFGTLVTLGLFFFLGNEWTAHNCVVVLVSGMVGYAYIVLALCSLEPIQHDDIDDEEEWADARDGYEEESSIHSDEEWFDPLIEDDDEALTATDVDPLLRIEPNDDGLNESETLTDNGLGSTCCADTSTFVPMLIHGSDAISSFASGLSAWYLPLFLVQSLGVRPLSLQFLTLIIPLGQRLSASIATLLANVAGSCLACILLQSIYISLLLGMVSCAANGYDVWKICFLYFLHGSLMNSTASLSLDMIANHIRHEEQYRWEFSQTVQKFIWSLGGLLGGWVATNHRYGISANLYSTAMVQLLASFPLFILYFLRNSPLETEEQDANSMEIDSDSDRDHNHEKTKQTTPIPSTPETESGVSEDGSWLV